MMEDRLRRLEVLSEISIELHRLSEESQQLILERQIQMEQQAEERQRQAEEYYGRMEGIPSANAGAVGTHGPDNGLDAG